jgi:hypothetical protein
MPITQDFIAAEIAALPQQPMLPLTGYGFDLSCLDQMEPRIVTGQELLRQALYRSLTTALQENFGEESYATDLMEFLHSKLTLAEKTAIIVGRIKSDARIVDAKCTARTVGVADMYEIQAQPVGEDQYISLSLIADPTGVVTA